MSREDAKERMRNSAAALEKIAGYFRAMAHGSIDPHSDRAKIVASAVRSVIRDLVEEWI
jgi:hypothetical protein